jgi:hypothetical protein
MNATIRSHSIWLVSGFAKELTDAVVLPEYRVTQKIGLLHSAIWAVAEEFTAI